jgi:hypothetical protein
LDTAIQISFEVENGDDNWSPSHYFFNNIWSGPHPLDNLIAFLSDEQVVV